MIIINNEYTLKRETFIHKGVIILTGSRVKVVSQEDDQTYSVLYMDQENMPNTISGIKTEELEG